MNTLDWGMITVVAFLIFMTILSVSSDRSKIKPDYKFILFEILLWGTVGAIFLGIAWMIDTYIWGFSMVVAITILAIIAILIIAYWNAGRTQKRGK